MPVSTLERTPWVKVARRAAKRRKTNSSQICDILGVILAFLGPISFVSLVTRDVGEKGELGNLISRSLTGLLGIGAYAAPVLFLLLGVLLIKPFKLLPRHSAIGIVTMFLVLLGWRQMDIEAAGSTELGGGLLGMAVAHTMDRCLGNASALGLFLVFVIALMITTNLPLRRWIDTALDYVQVVAEGTREGIGAAASKPSKNGKKEPKEELKVRKPLFGLGRSADENGEEDESAVPVETAAREREVVIKMPAAASHKRESVQEPVLELSGDGDEDGEFRLPPLSLLAEPQPPPARVEAELRGNIEIIERTLEEFRVTATVVEIAHGPTVTRYEVQLAPGIKVSKITGLADNLAMQLAAIDVRVEAPIPGKAAIGVEVPNKLKGTVGLREVIASDVFKNSESPLTFALGKDVSGEPRLADLAKMPHMLVAGATNSGKSVALNALIASLLFRNTPDQLKLILIDPKRVELSLFDGIPHLACPVVKDVRMAAGAFRQTVKEMDRRYELFSRAGVRNIAGYNERMPEGDKLPYIVLVVDELADLMMQAGAEVEQLIARLAQLARATGIHLVIATQRPSVDVVTGLIKANISSRIAFAVSSQVDSRTILDQNGAERLIGRGDMLFLPIDASKPTRIQGCYLSEKEIEALVQYLKSQRKPVYIIEPTEAAGMGGGVDDDSINDEFYEAAVRLIVAKGSCSTSMLQRRFKIGYTRAARLVDAMEQHGIVGPLDGAKPREVLVTPDDLDRIFGGQNSLFEGEEPDGEDEE